jgi:hypothetical protein
MLDPKIICPILENHDDLYETIEKNPFCPTFPVRREVRFYYDYNHKEIGGTILLQKIIHYYKFAMMEYLQGVKKNDRINDDYEEYYYMRDNIVEHVHNRYVYSPNYVAEYIRRNAFVYIEIYPYGETPYGHAEKMNKGSIVINIGAVRKTFDFDREKGDEYVLAQKIPMTKNVQIVKNISLSFHTFNETFKKISNSGNGNCLFLAVQFFFPTETHLSLRKKVADYYSAHIDEHKNNIFISASHGKKIRKEGVWGEASDVFILGEILNVTIKVYMKNNKANKYEGVIATQLPEQKNTIHLILQDRHYEALSIINEKQLAPKCLKKSRKCEPTNVHKTGIIYPRCPRRSRRNKKSGECEPTNVHKTGIIYPRCPRRSRRNKKSGECEPIVPIQI